VKVYFGHVLDLKDEVDRIFLARLVSVEKGDGDTYTCPKLIGLPDMIKSGLDNLPPLVEFVVDIQNRSLRSSARRLAEEFGVPSASARKPLKEALAVQSRFQDLLARGVEPGDAIGSVLGRGEAEASAVRGRGNGPRPGARALRIAVVGHEYLVFDTYVSHNLPSRLRRMGVEPVHALEVSSDMLDTELRRYPGISWSYEKELLGAASHFMRRKDIDGVLLVMCFACGPDSIVGEIINREVRSEDSPPLMTLILDEHTGEAGVATRVEAFVDLIRRSGGRR